MASGEDITAYNRVEIDLGALRGNYRQIRARVGGGARVMAIVKADAYGHGLVPVAQALAAEGCGFFGVAEVDEGIGLRRAGVAGEIVVLLGVMPDSFAAIIEFGLQTVVYDREVLGALAAHAARRNRSIGIHLKIDTGMGRLGLMPDQLDSFLELLNESPGLRLAGILSHFPRADDRDDLGQALDQNRRFAEIVARIRKCCGGAPVHIANSAALLNLPDSHFDMVRPGITLYGCYPVPADRGESDLQLQPVMSFKTRIIQVKDVPSGYGISYGHTYRTERPTRLAVLPVGYADGYLRRLTGRAEVLIAGSRAPILGRICMNACLADITGLDRVKAGDEAVIMGRQGREEITADEIAGWSETISYEILCLFGGRNQRVYLRSEELAGRGEE
ncbi:MAG: alanine racemase [Desulfurivibrionaceae bacterium]|nr:alanine racemase [Desulfobulbales bacterium]MDT8334789.1 alanine racemase [Desulfurivibrionaceae bacterium]